MFWRRENNSQAELNYYVEKMCDEPGSLFKFLMSAPKDMRW